MTSCQEKTLIADGVCAGYIGCRTIIDVVVSKGANMAELKMLICRRTTMFEGFVVAMAGVIGHGIDDLYFSQ